MNNAILPCPFCGGDGILADTFTENHKTWFCYVRCKECGAGVSDSASSDEEAINRVVKNWNTRHERTCRMVFTNPKEPECRCDKCGFDYVIGDDIAWYGGRFVYLRGYCKNCGAKVVDE